MLLVMVRTAPKFLLRVMPNPNMWRVARRLILPLPMHSIMALRPEQIPTLAALFVCRVRWWLVTRITGSPD